MARLEKFTYRAARRDSQVVVRGEIEAVSESSAAARLRAQGLVPLDIAAVPTTGLRREISLGRGRRVGPEELALFSRQMSSLTGAGLPLMRVLSILLEQTSDRSLRQAIESVRADVESGSSLSVGLARHPRVFPPLMVAIVRVGETGGFLDESLASIARMYQADAELRAKVRAATTYPIVVLVVALVAVIAMVTFVVPVFEGMFASLGSELPLPTQVLVSLSKNMVWILLLLLVVGVLFFAWWVTNRDRPGIRRVVDRMRLRLPIVGTLLTKVAVARFARNLSMMLHAGVPLLSALETVGAAADNVVVADALQQVRESVRAGKSFATPLERAHIFPSMVAQMVAVGEESGTLPDMLASVADYYEAEVKTETDRLTSVIEPLLIVILGVVIGGMVIALYMPIFSVYGELNQRG